MTEIDETIREFLVESFENLDQLSQDLIALEEDPSSQDVINRIFRIVHTIKGTCGFFEFKNLEAVSHVGENLLDSLRDGKIQVCEKIISALLQLGDALRSMMVNIEEQGTDYVGDYSDLIELLTELNQADSRARHPADAVPQMSEVVESSNREEPGTDMQASEEEDLERLFSQACRDYAEHKAVDSTPAAVVETSFPAEAAVPEMRQGVESQKAPSGEEPRKSEIAETSLRVDINLLDRLMNLVGELVLARNQILQFTKNHGDGDFVSTSQRLNLITSELQDGVMRTRMQPIANVWNKLPRIVRDVAHACGKQVRLEMFGKETELDKTIIEAIKDPLTHIIRNAVDHGIESPDIRLRAGKGPEGTLTMKAFHEGGQVIIEISDDGAGLNTERIRRKAIEKHVVSAEKVARMGDQDIHRLIFLPGFSTAEKVTNISGRGVGMDVVRTNIERIGGTVDVAAHARGGTVFTIKIPLTLAIIPALVVTAAGNRYAIPQVNLLELVRIEGEQIRERIEELQGSFFYRLRGKLLPIVRLRSELALDSASTDIRTGEQVLSIVVVRADNHQFGLVVDEIHDTEEIVVKPLGKLVKGVPAFAGATIMGDGQVALILDVVGLGRNARISKEDGMPGTDEKSAETVSSASRQKFLIFQLEDGRRAAVPLEAVHRLEEFSREQLEVAGESTVVQYRDGILPLVDLQKALSGARSEHLDVVRAFVYQHGQVTVGFTVKRILDIVEQAIKLERPSRRRGLLGSAIIQERVTDVVDLNSVLRDLDISSGVDEQYSENAQ